mmetsp:Transcript_37458/g.87125  ORF Transcript_37458/g.87125 Transcript_37458/m.87125 type:complete len:247 (+) Transcript_37458:580-1320(+)
MAGSTSASSPTRTSRSSPALDPRCCAAPLIGAVGCTSLASGPSMPPRTGHHLRNCRPSLRAGRSPCILGLAPTLRTTLRGWPHSPLKPPSCLAFAVSCTRTGRASRHSPCVAPARVASVASATSAREPRDLRTETSLQTSSTPQTYRCDGCSHAAPFSSTPPPTAPPWLLFCLAFRLLSAPSLANRGSGRPTWSRWGSPRPCSPSKSSPPRRSPPPSQRPAITLNSAARPRRCETACCSWTASAPP